MGPAGGRRGTGLEKPLKEPVMKRIALLSLLAVAALMPDGAYTVKVTVSGMS